MNKQKQKPFFELYLDGSRGQYLPQAFAEHTKLEIMQQAGISDDDIEILKAGPDHEWYWESWEMVLNNFRYQHPKYGTITLYQDGDLFMGNGAGFAEYFNEDED